MARKIYGFSCVCGLRDANSKQNTLKNANVPVRTSWMLGQDVEMISADGKLQTDTSEAIWQPNYTSGFNREVRLLEPLALTGTNVREYSRRVVENREPRNPEVGTATIMHFGTDEIASVQHLTAALLPNALIRKLESLGRLPVKKLQLDRF